MKNTKEGVAQTERARRQAAVDFARGSLRLEGLVLDDAAEAVATRFVAGELSCAEMISALQDLVVDDGRRASS